MNCSGDGSYGQGRAHEAMLMAMNWELPIIFFCENNGMAIHSTASDMHPTGDVSSLAQGYGMPAMVVDGQDVFACAEASLSAIERARAGKGPTFIEAKTVRFKEHDMGTPDLKGWEARSDEEKEELRQLDPLKLATARMLSEGVLSQADIDHLHEEATLEVAKVEDFADNSEIARPSEHELLAGVFAS